MTAVIVVMGLARVERFDVALCLGVFAAVESSEDPEALGTWLADVVCRQIRNATRQDVAMIWEIRIVEWPGLRCVR